jgi:N-acetyl sugar amidotransferase
MKYCKVCLQPNTRPNSKFSKAGICPACNYYNDLKFIDWHDRYNILIDTLSNFQRKKNQNYDCIIGVSGGKDSTRQALWVRDKLGLTPLLVSLTYPPQQITSRGAENISNLIELGFDLISISPRPGTWKKLIKKSFFKFSNWARSAELALFSSVPQIAIKYNIPLIFWGENPALQVGDLKTMGSNGYDGNNLRYSNTLSSGHQWMLKNNITLDEILPYIYPSKNDFKISNVQIIYLGWFLGDWNLLNNGTYSCLNGLKIRKEKIIDTGDLYGISNLDEDWHNLNQMFKYYKFGFGKVTEYINEEIRAGLCSRKEGIDIIARYDGACSKKIIQSFCDYIEISQNTFYKHLYKAVNKDLFFIDSEGQIHRKFKIGIGI